ITCDFVLRMLGGFGISPALSRNVKYDGFKFNFDQCTRWDQAMHIVRSVGRRSRSKQLLVGIAHLKPRSLRSQKYTRTDNSLLSATQLSHSFKPADQRTIRLLVSV